MAKYLDGSGLTYLWSKIKTAISNAISGISLPIAGVKIDEKVISLDGSNYLQATLSIGYDSASQKIQLHGIDNEVISEFSAADFVKDGFLDSAELVEVSSSQAGTSGFPSTAGTYIKFTWNTEAGKSVSWVDVTSLIDVYTAGNGIDITNNVISLKIDSTQGSNRYCRL